MIYNNPKEKITLLNCKMHFNEVMEMKKEWPYSNNYLRRVVGTLGFDCPLLLQMCNIFQNK